MNALKVLKIGPAASVQDGGRPGLLDQGVSRGGAADVLALAEGAALLRQDPGLAALEMGGMGGTFEATAPLRIALTGAPMAATLDGAALAWNASHRIEAGQRLDIGPARRGVYGYLHLGGGIDTEPVLGSRSAHVAAGLGRAVAVGDLLPAGSDGPAETGLTLAAEDRFQGGELRIVESFQSALFPPDVRNRFAETEFTRGSRANRMGVEMLSEGEGFAAAGQLNILSEVIVPGDVQMTGDGKPFVLLREAQTTGGYPRIGTVLPCDLPKVAQAQAGASIRFRWVSLEEGLQIQDAYDRALRALPGGCHPLLRDPADIQDLLSYQLVSGAVSALADPFAIGGDT
ncbi:biotin-dependent carboxyltransferase family protein [Phaeobacter gallaeciensis]|uniref:5-oxoprolinase subunit C family protein n=1 Tax=Phaeobacter gallaeciensis TaxID=60890 RepID=UPI0023804714|nr:biotin-dependent carboxyltransferase family protein [Phaeobacter gallaeciensis]MDE4276792.1 biotin-dependent carboxyltransferase family protein [Phaeobacter gallaeciensis]MDE4302020.1 biotin-dependent carboxyltransferase family protein [Phaeobacter gallaeciensis]MDE5187216.1 biotin-dependent carboxyltransferase family protein [Phaeobacter gallaeciensis]MEC9310494.1 biotin-dependent carboxyltransferase family protein [Pseudomonadota bacterium]